LLSTTGDKVIQIEIAVRSGLIGMLLEFGLLTLGLFCLIGAVKLSVLSTMTTPATAALVRMLSKKLAAGSRENVAFTLVMLVFDLLTGLLGSIHHIYSPAKKYSTNRNKIALSTPVKKNLKT
jgi:hypothetical protein